MSILQQLKDGEVAIEFDKVHVDDLNKVLKHVFPEDDESVGGYNYYMREGNIIYDCWEGNSRTDLPSYPLQDFINELNELK